jgi:capping protein alpha
LSENIEQLRSAVQKSLEVYTSDLYKANKATVSVYGADNGTITICLSAKNVNLSNYWTGSWRSVYTLSNGDLKGFVKIGVHYFEDGNVQLHTNVEHAAKVSNASPDATASEVRKAIETFETSYQNQLEEMYVNMHRNTFKNMRRFLPLNKVKFQWNSAAHSLASEVTNK